MAPKSGSDLLQGTLDLLILETLALGPQHGWGISPRIRQMSRWRRLPGPRAAPSRSTR